MSTPTKKWHHCLIGEDGKLAVVTIGFFIWMVAVTVGWSYLTLSKHELQELPSTVVHLTLALGATKVTHKLAETDWSKVAEKLIDVFHGRKPPEKS